MYRIPAEAENILYYQPPPFTAVIFAEFEIDYSGFAEWAERWRSVYPELSSLKLGSMTTYEILDDSSSFKDKHLRDIKIADWSAKDEYLALGYDAQKQRAYVVRHYR